MRLYFFFTLIGFFTSCHGQENNSVSGNVQVSNNLRIGANEQVILSDSALQIDQYVVEIFEDKVGHLWFGTISRGVARYDGKSITYFSTQDGLIDNTVASIAQDSSGNMWFGTHEGGSKYDGKTFTNFGRAQGLHGPGCKFLIDRNGDVWAGSNDGVFRYNGVSFTQFDLPEPELKNLSYKWVPGKIWAIVQDKEGNIWFGRDGFGACKYDGKTFTHFTKEDGLASNNVSSILIDKHDHIWFGTLTSDFPANPKEGGLTRYDGKTFTQFPQLNGLSESDTYTIYEDKGGNIWIGAIGNGAYRFDGKQFILFKEADRNDLIVNFGLQAMLEDRNGTLWCGFSGGLFRFDGTRFINVTQEGPWK